MKNIKKKILAIVAGCMFAGMMMLNVNTTINDSNFSVTGLMSLAYGTTGGGDNSYCQNQPQLNNGKCVLNAHGDHFCAIPYWWQIKDCVQ